MNRTKSQVFERVSDENSKAYTALSAAYLIPAEGLTLREAYVAGRAINRALESLTRLGRTLAELDSDLE